MTITSGRQTRRASTICRSNLLGGVAVVQLVPGRQQVVAAAVGQVRGDRELPQRLGGGAAGLAARPRRSAGRRPQRINAAAAGSAAVTRTRPVR